MHTDPPAWLPKRCHKVEAVLGIWHTPLIRHLWGRRGEVLGWDRLLFTDAFSPHNYIFASWVLTSSLSCLWYRRALPTYYWIHEIAHGNINNNLNSRFIRCEFVKPKMLDNMGQTHTSWKTNTHIPASPGSQYTHALCWMTLSPQQSWPATCPVWGEGEWLDSPRPETHSLRGRYRWRGTYTTHLKGNIKVHHSWMGNTLREVNNAPEEGNKHTMKMHTHIEKHKRSRDRYYLYH